VLQVVCIKQVPDTETRVKVAADGRSLDTSGVTLILNPYDEFAVEQALRVKEQLGAGEVVVMTVGSTGVQTTLRNVLAMGADRAIHLKTDTVAPDGLSVARVIADAIRPLAAGVVWFGEQDVDNDAAQGPMVAMLLGRPCDRARQVRAGRPDRQGRWRDRKWPRVIEVPLLAVFINDKGLNEPATRRQGHHGGEEEGDRGAGGGPGGTGDRTTRPGDAPASQARPHRRRGRRGDT
jgi:electron transfer flavoprotein beta subunit